MTLPEHRRVTAIRFADYPAELSEHHGATSLLEATI
jgi:hypothetical protein